MRHDNETEYIDGEAYGFLPGSVVNRLQRETRESLKTPRRSKVEGDKWIKRDNRKH